MVLPVCWMFILVLTSKQILNGEELVSVGMYPCKWSSEIGHWNFQYRGVKAVTDMEWSELPYYLEEREMLKTWLRTATVCSSSTYEDKGLFWLLILEIMGGSVILWNPTMVFMWAPVNLFIMWPGSELEKEEDTETRVFPRSVPNNL